MNATLAIRRSIALAVTLVLAGGMVMQPALAANAVRDLGRLGPHKPVRIGILMRYRNENELAALVLMQGDRSSHYYHRYLSNAQWNAYYAPDPSTYARTIALLRRRGFHIDRLYANRSMIAASGPAALAERYFRTTLHAVAQAGYGERYRNVAPFSVPAELGAVAENVSGLDATVHVTDAMRFAPANHVAPDVARRAASPQAVSTSTPGPNPSPDPTISPFYSPEQDSIDTGGYGPGIWADAYDFPVQHGYGGSGYAMGSVINADFHDSDLAGELSGYAIVRTGKQFRVYTDGTFDAPFVSEAGLDAEVESTLAPNADFYEYITQYFDEAGLEGAYEQAVSDNIVATLSSSFGECETNDPSFENATNYIAMQGVAKGITFDASAGDTGSGACGITITNGVPGTSTGVEVPCADSYFVCTGGTSFEPIASATSYTAELAWIAGGGGVSAFEPIPDWQSGTPNVIASGRNVPDIAFAADNVAPAMCFSAYINGIFGEAGGMSVGSPMFAAMQLEIDQAQGSRNGFVTPRLYDVGNQAESFAFRDITVGTNGAYTAKTGYDNITGFGSPRGFELAGAE